MGLRQSTDKVSQANGYPSSTTIPISSSKGSVTIPQGHSIVVNPEEDPVVYGLSPSNSGSLPSSLPVSLVAPSPSAKKGRYASDISVIVTPQSPPISPRSAFFTSNNNDQPDDAAGKQAASAGRWWWGRSTSATTAPTTTISTSPPILQQPSPPQSPSASPPPSPLHRSTTAEQQQQDLDFVPTVFTWTHGGKQVFLAGDFNQWKRVPMIQNERDFTAIVAVAPGEHQYKFIVDGKWLYAPELPIASDPDGNLNNVITVNPPPPPTFKNKEEPSTPPGSYSQLIPPPITPHPLPPQPNQPTQYVVPVPPSLPPHLARALLNTRASGDDPASLPQPHYVMLNHLYSYPRDDVLILGLTHRYKAKFVTTVFYKPTKTPHTKPATLSIPATTTTTTTTVT